MNGESSSTARLVALILAQDAIVKHNQPIPNAQCASAIESGIAMQRAAIECGISTEHFDGSARILGSIIVVKGAVVEENDRVFSYEDRPAPMLIVEVRGYNTIIGKRALGKECSGTNADKDSSACK